MTDSLQILRPQNATLRNDKADVTAFFGSAQASMV